MKCGEKSDTCDDYCLAKKLVEYDNDCIQDSTPISCDQYCNALGTCQDCTLPSCPPTITHCCDGVNKVCGAECATSTECPCSETDGCQGPDYYDYPEFGACTADCICATGTASGQPCEPTIDYNSPLCNQPPDKPTLPPEYPGGVSWDHCSVKALSIPIFHWIYSDPDGDNQTAYEIWVDDDSNFPDPKFNYLVEHIPLPGPQFSYRLDLNHDKEGDWLSELAWSATYYWKVKVRDDHNNWSEWSTSTLFTTPLHAAPWPEFTLSPNRVSLNQVVTFEDNSKCYTSPGNDEFNCQDLVPPSYEWDFDYIEPTFTVDDTTKGNAATSYNEVGNYKIKLRITDDIDTCYSETESVTVTLPLPEWMEIPPF